MYPKKLQGEEREGETGGGRGAAPGHSLPGAASRPSPRPPPPARNSMRLAALLAVAAACLGASRGRAGGADAPLMRQPGAHSPPSPT